MKPTKNRYFCLACGRSKMLFEDEKAALNFIKFNKDEVEDENGKAPIRAYYCSLCAGYHVTSNPSVEFFENYKSRAERKVDEILLDKKIKKVVKIYSYRNKGNEHLQNKDYLKAADVFLCGYHSLKTSAAEEAEYLVNEAVRVMCLGLAELMDEEDVTEEEGYKYSRILLRLSRACKKFPQYKEHIDVFTASLKKLFPELEIVPETKQQEPKVQLKLSKKNQAKIRTIETSISLAEFYLSHDQSHEAYLTIRDSVLSNFHSCSANKELHPILIPKVENVLSLLEETRKTYDSPSYEETLDKLLFVYKIVKGEIPVDQLLNKDTNKTSSQIVPAADKLKEEKLKTLSDEIASIERRIEEDSPELAQSHIGKAKSCLKSLSNDLSIKDEIIPLIDELIAAIEHFNNTYPVVIEDSEE